MIRSSSIRVTVEFSGSKRPEGYIVAIEPEGGNAVGTYGGSGNIDKKNQMFFQTVPPGKYILTGHPNPSSENENTEPVTVELKGGESLEVKLKAK
jgi:hypothetical protein